MTASVGDEGERTISAVARYRTGLSGTKPDQAGRENSTNFPDSLVRRHVQGVDRVRHVHRRDHLRDWIPLASTHGADDPSQSDRF